MPDIGWMELLVIGIVALIVVGPKDLPMMFRKVGQFTGRIRAMARDFQRAMDQAADESGMTELNRDLKAAAKFTNPKKMGMDALKDTLDDIDPSKFEEGSETRRLAEEKAAKQREAREAAEAKRAAREQAAISAKNAVAEAEGDAPLMAEPTNTPVAEPEAVADTELPPAQARTGSDP